MEAEAARMRRLLVGAGLGALQLPDSCKRVADLCVLAESLPNDDLQGLNKLLSDELLVLTRPLSADTMAGLMKTVLVEPALYDLFMEMGIDQLAFLLEMEQLLQDPDQVSLREVMTKIRKRRTFRKLRAVWAELEDGAPAVNFVCGLLFCKSNFTFDGGGQEGPQKSGPSHIANQPNATVQLQPAPPPLQSQSQPFAAAAPLTPFASQSPFFLNGATQSVLPHAMMSPQFTMQPPFFSQPVMQQPIAHQPVVPQPLLQQPFIYQPVVPQPALQQPVAQKPEAAQQPAVVVAPEQKPPVDMQQKAPVATQQKQPPQGDKKQKSAARQNAAKPAKEAAVAKDKPTTQRQEQLRQAPAPAPAAHTATEKTPAPVPVEQPRSNANDDSGAVDARSGTRSDSGAHKSSVPAVPRQGANGALAASNTAVKKPASSKVVNGKGSLATPKDTSSDPAQRPHDDDTDSDTAVTCPICLSIYTNPYSVLPCKHVFCLNCIVSCVKKSVTGMRCPICKTVFENFVRDEEMAKMCEALMPDAEHAEGDDAAHAAELEAAVLHAERERELTELMMRAAPPSVTAAAAAQSLSKAPKDAFKDTKRREKVRAREDADIRRVEAETLRMHEELQAERARIAAEERLRKFEEQLERERVEREAKVSRENFERASQEARAAREAREAQAAAEAAAKDAQEVAQVAVLVLQAEEAAAAKAAAEIAAAEAEARREHERKERERLQDLLAFLEDPSVPEPTPAQPAAVASAGELKRQAASARHVSTPAAQASVPASAPEPTPAPATRVESIPLPPPIVMVQAPPLQALNKAKQAKRDAGSAVDLTCPVCHKMFVRPSKLSPCAHVFCKECITSDACLTCTDPIMSVQPDGAMAKLVAEARARNPVEAQKMQEEKRAKEMTVYEHANKALAETLASTSRDQKSFFALEAAKKITCPQCHALLKQPKRLSPCAHVMCQSCLGAECGVCHEPIMSVAPDATSVQLVDAFIRAHQ